MAQTFSGSLKTKRKGDLQTIASSLGLDLSPEALKGDYEKSIRSVLLSSPQHQSDPRYVGLVHSIQHERATSDGGPPSSVGSAVASPVKAVKRAARRKSTAELSDAGESGGLVNGASLSELASRAEVEFENTLDRALAAADTAFTSLGPLRSNSVRGLARRTSMKFRDATETSVEVTAAAVVEAQQTLSSPWVLLSLGVVTELIYIVASVLPLVKRSYPPIKWIFYDLTSPTQHFHFCLPDLTVLVTYAFLRPLATYIFLTLLLPLVVSLLISFPPPLPTRSGSVSSVTTRAIASARKTISPPNAFTFAVVRLALIVLVQSVFASPEGYAYGWETGRFGIGGLGGVGAIGGHGLKALKGVQLVGAASGVALTFYEAALL